jgi:hypothetical protein
MQDDQIVESPLSKTKLALLTFGAALFVAAGVWLLVAGSKQTLYDPTIMRLVGGVSIAFFGLCFSYALRKLFDKSPGLKLSPEGLLDNSSGISAGAIPWNQVTKVTVSSIHFQKFLTVHVRNPSPYMTRGNALKRIANQANLKITGSPINISSSALQIEFNDLVKLVQQNLEKYGSA